MKKFWRNFKLRMALFRIWFMKNILVWIQIFCIVCFVCIFTGAINENTPFFGKVIYPIFAPLADSINDIIKEKGIEDLMGFTAIVVSVLASVGIFTLKAKSIAINDIKSKKLKMALIKANLYFNEDGKLTKRVEKMTNKDVDCDGKVGNKEVENEAQVNYGVISGVVTAAKELGVIMTADLSGSDEEAEAAFEKAIDDTDSRGTKEVLDDKKAFETNLKADAAIEMAEESIEKVENDLDMTEEEKKEKISVFKRIINLFKRKKVERVDDGLEPDEEEPEVLSDEIELDEPEDNSEPTPEVVVSEPVAPVTTTVPQQTTVQSATKSDADAFLDSLRNRRR